MPRILVFLACCATAQACAQKVQFNSLPELFENPSGNVPLAAVIEFRSDQSLDAVIEVSDGKNEWQATFSDGAAEEGQYTLPIVGMRAGREHAIRLALTAEDGSSYEQVFSHETSPLPLNPLEIPPLDVKISDTERMEPGILFLSVRRRALGRPAWLTQKQRRFATDWGMLIAVDQQGEIIWYYQSPFRTAGIARLSNGNILMHRTDFSTVEIDLLGNVVRQFYAEKRPLPPPENPDAIAIKGQQTLHHQPHELPNGNYLAFSANAHLIKDWYSDEYDPDAPRKDQLVMADTVVEITPQGETVWSWDTMEYLDPFRIGYDTDWAYWPVRGFPNHLDWTHANGLSWDSSDNSILVSLRNQSAILKIDYATKDIKWILGRHEDWPKNLQDKLLEPVGELLWPGYQHNPRMTHAGTVILFDNRAHGGARPFEKTPPVQESFSRGVEYAVDEASMTVQQVWTSGDEQGDDPCYANAMSDAWRLPETDNRLLIFAFCAPLHEGLTQDPADETRRYLSDFPYGARIVEYADNDPVFRMEIVDGHDLVQWEAYGGFKTPEMYLDANRTSYH